MQQRKILPCEHCGAPVECHVRASHIACDACRERLWLPRYVMYAKLKREGKELDLPVVIVKDPDTEFGFRPGASFPLEDYRAMLARGCLTPGTVLEVKGQRRLILATTGGGICEAVG